MKALQLDFLLSVLNRVGAMADVATDSEAEVATNSTCKVQGAFSYQNKGSQKIVTYREQRPEGSLHQASHGQS